MQQSLLVGATGGTLDALFNNGAYAQASAAEAGLILAPIPYAYIGGGRRK
jgi:hypothetical protein